MRFTCFFLLVLVVFSAKADEAGVERVFNQVVTHAKTRSENYQVIPTLFPKNFSANDYGALVQKIMLSGLDLDDVGDIGLTWLNKSLSYSLQQLSKIPYGGYCLISLKEDLRITWDASFSQELCDAIVHRGKEMLPLLKDIKEPHKEWANRCGSYIKNGQKTAF